jgi:hypothetical protein
VVQSDQPLAGGGTLEVVASPEIGCDSFKQKEVTVTSGVENPSMRELGRHHGVAGLRKWLGGWQGGWMRGGWMGGWLARWVGD